MLTARPLVSVAVGLCLPCSHLAAQELDFGGQLRPRLEYRDPLPPQDGNGDSFVSMRARVDLLARLEGDVEVFLQIQDVRTWGEESNTLFDFDADNLDLHQGHIDVNRGGETARLSGRLGRQEVSFGGERLVGAVDWTQQARAFDGLRLSADAPAFRIDLLAAILADDLTEAHADDAQFYAAYGQLREVGPAALDLYALYYRIARADGTDQLTVGARWWGRKNGIVFRMEGSYQTGDRSGVDVSAFMLGGRLGLELAGGAASATLWYDYLSGDDEPDDAQVKVFDTLFATNHKFYGLADYFLDIPAQTGGRGLQDIALKGAWRAPEDVQLRAELHTFHAAAGDGLDSGHFADEIDLSAGYPYTDNLSLIGGFSYLFVGDGFAEIGRAGGDATWMYLMADVRF